MVPSTHEHRKEWAPGKVAILLGFSSGGFGGLSLAAATGDFTSVNKGGEGGNEYFQVTKQKAGSGSTWETAPGSDFHDNFEGRWEVSSEGPLEKTGRRDSQNVYHFMTFTVILFLVQWEWRRKRE